MLILVKWEYVLIIKIRQRNNWKGLKQVLIVYIVTERGPSWPKLKTDGKRLSYRTECCARLRR
jgi:hypothetical protein